MEDNIKLGKQCPDCGYDEWIIVDNKNEYDEICSKCAYINVYVKQDFVSKFECSDCGSLSGTLEENDYKLGVRCNNCNKLHIMIEKQTTINNRNKQIVQKNNQPKCPMCGSTNISKISAMSRATSIIGFGILSKKIGKQWQCNNPKCRHMR